MAKIAAVLPAKLQQQLSDSGLLIASSQVAQGKDEFLMTIRKALRLEKKLEISYLDLKNERSQRIIWPLGLGFFDQVRILIAWCELREDFRHFRTDKIIECCMLDAQYPQKRRKLLREWQRINNIPDKPLQTY